MIYQLGSDLPSFKTLTFKPGFNLLLARKEEGASDRQTRNGSGKSSLIEIIHFLLGARTDKKALCLHPSLEKVQFWMDLDLGKKVHVCRTGKSKIGLVGLSGASPTLGCSRGWRPVWLPLLRRSR